MLPALLLVSEKEAGYNENGEQMEQIQKNTDRLGAREKLLERVKNFTLLSDVFLSVVLRDKAACQHVLRLLTGREKLTVKAVRTQYRISKIISHDAILDVLAGKNACTIWKYSAGIPSITAAGPDFTAQ